MRIESDVSLAQWCTLGVGGPARAFCRAESEDDVLEALRWGESHELAVTILGGGSNVVIADRGIDGLVVQIAIAGVETSDTNQHRRFSVGAGEPWDQFVASTVDADCAGLECLSGIPGLVGGTPVQNVGAYGQDVSETITEVSVIDRAQRVSLTMSAADCGFAYRSSRFKHADAGRFIVTRVNFRLRPGGAPTVAYADVVAHFQQAGIASPTLRQVREAILQIRRRKGMVIEEGNPANQSVGSFFVNPVISRANFEQLMAAAADSGESVPHYPLPNGDVKVPAAWLIEHAGYRRGYDAGPVGVSPFQSQAIINRGAARAEDVMTLACDIKRAVWQKFGVAIVPEPVFVGFQRNQALQWLLDPNPAEGRKDL